MKPWKQLSLCILGAIACGSCVSGPTVREEAFRIDRVALLEFSSDHLIPDDRIFNFGDQSFDSHGENLLVAIYEAARPRLQEGLRPQVELLDVADLPESRTYENLSSRENAATVDRLKSLSSSQYEEIGGIVREMDVDAALSVRLQFAVDQNFDNTPAKARCSVLVTMFDVESTVIWEQEIHRSARMPGGFGEFGGALMRSPPQNVMQWRVKQACLEGLSHFVQTYLKKRTAFRSTL